MIELRGKYNSTKVFTDNIEQTAVDQIIELCNQEFLKDSKVRIMPDCHAGAGCTIGTTMTIKDKVVPNLVGVDIGCGVGVVKISNKDIDFAKLDKVIRKYIPFGQEVRKSSHKNANQFESNLIKLKCFNNINFNRAVLAIGTLGGGNHFIEMNKDLNDNLYLVVHTGSRYLGKQVAKYYQDLAYKSLLDKKLNKKEIIDKLKKEGREKEIERELNNIKTNDIKINKELAYVEGINFDNYINDMKITQKFSSLNRKTIIDIIVEKMNFDVVESFETIHNYIDIENMILRKGSISARLGEKLIIPINMADGSLICIGKGNEDWNYSAPHGAGRLMSRGKAKKLVTIDEFQERMKGIWSTSVTPNTIDESPMAYKNIEEIMANIEDTVEIVDIIKPLYNFKAN